MTSRDGAAGAQPVVIIGAPRSGTNILRDVLTRVQGVETWPCDEINYIWRHGNRAFPTDEFTPEMATPGVCRYIRQAFGSMAARTGARWLVEKTCANSLRVRFVDRVVPDARYLYIVRDGRDVVASALKRWRAPLEPRYLARKARFVPTADLPYYALRYLGNRVHRVVSGDRGLAVWGPRFEGMEEYRAGSLERLCAAQWARCVDASDAQLAAIDPARVHRIGYEEFVAGPAPVLAGVAEFLGLPVAPEAWRTLAGDVFTGSVGKGRQELGAPEMRAVEPIIGPVLARHGYG